MATGAIDVIQKSEKITSRWLSAGLEPKSKDNDSSNDRQPEKQAPKDNKLYL